MGKLSFARGARLRRTRACAATVVLVLAIATACSATNPGSDAGCEAPHLESESATVAPGTLLKISGEAFIVGCADTEMNGNPGETESPMSDVVLTVTQEGLTVRTTDVTIDADGSFTVSVELPNDLSSAPLIVTTDATGSEPLEIPVAQ